MSQTAIRAALKASPDGLNITCIANQVHKPTQLCRRMIAVMPDIYVGGWVKATRGKALYTQVYVIVDVPEDSPRPD